MQPIDFCKFSGNGNDFVIIDNRAAVFPVEDRRDFIARVCRRKLSVGADGLILIEPSQRVDFRWRFYNADGGEAEMCGNGARCAARFAYLQGIAGKTLAFETAAGVVEAQVHGERVMIGIPPPADFKMDYDVALPTETVRLSSVNTGVPHAAVETEDIDSVDVVRLGRALRWHADFAPQGTNANFVQRLAEGRLAVRTYERGVEDETLACGTGSVAAAVLMARKYRWQSPVTVTTRSGTDLTVHFRQQADTYAAVRLEGEARLIYSARLAEDAWRP
jgi:diaminopimelate epimerase